MNRTKNCYNYLALFIVAGLLVLQWIGVTHTHDSDIDVDRICSICLVKKNISHGAVSPALFIALDVAFTGHNSLVNIQPSRVNLSYYYSRAPPVNL